jgi:DNA-binding MarR family transcriptional regulator
MTNNNSLRVPDYRALADFRYQIRSFLRFSEKAARDAGVEPQHHQLMLTIKGAPENIEPRIGYLAERLQIHHHSAVELVDRLARRGLIKRFRGVRDRREVHVKLTSKGERLLKELTLHNRAELRTKAPALVSALKHMMTAWHGNRKATGRKNKQAARTRSNKSK